MQSYKTILQLDKAVREFYVPPPLRVPGFDRGPSVPEDEQSSFKHVTQRYDVYGSKLFSRLFSYRLRSLSDIVPLIAIMHMHRGYFAKAMEDCPDDPLASKYSPSVLAVYDAACSFIGLMKTFHSQFPVIERMWFIISPIVSCAVRALIRPHYGELIFDTRSSSAPLRRRADWQWHLLHLVVWRLRVTCLRECQDHREAAKF